MKATWGSLRQLPSLRFAIALSLGLALLEYTQADEIADSFDDWSRDGTQGENNWFNGYYNLTQDDDQTYDVADFIPYENDGSSVVEADGLNHWSGSRFLLYRDTAAGTGFDTGPWTRIAREDAHPNGLWSFPPFSIRGARAEEHWAVRRWVADDLASPTQLELTWHLRAQNLNGGDGTGGILFHNGVELDSALIGGTDAEGVTRTVLATVNPGDMIDLALTPENLDGSRTEGNDGSAFRLTIVSEFSPGALQAGDADQDLDFDQLDLVRVQIAGKYLTGQAATWGEGDWDGSPGGNPGNPPAGDGVFSQLDIIAALGAGKYLTGPYAAIYTDGVPNDGKTSIIYDARSGELGVDAPAGMELTSVNIDSAAGIFAGDPARNLGGSFDNDADNNIFKATFGSSFGSLSFGNVARSGLSEDFVLNDLSVVGSLAGGGDLGAVDLIYVPEPTAISLLALGLAGALLMRRRQRS